MLKLPSLDYECSCAGKVPYANRHVAEAAARNLRERRGQRGVRGPSRWIGAYQCRYCNAWHTGHQKQLKRRLYTAGKLMNYKRLLS